MTCTESGLSHVRHAFRAAHVWHSGTAVGESREKVKARETTLTAAVVAGAAKFQKNRANSCDSRGAPWRDWQVLAGP